MIVTAPRKSSPTIASALKTATDTRPALPPLLEANASGSLNVASARRAMELPPRSSDAWCPTNASVARLATAREVMSVTAPRPTVPPIALAVAFATSSSASTVMAPA